LKKLKELWKSEYFKTIVLILVAILWFLAFWFGSRIVFKTDTPYLAVSSGSMVPTHNIGDLIVIEGGINGSEIRAGYYNPNNSSECGDIVVYRNPTDPAKLIVHRVIEKYYDEKEGEWFFMIKGDRNPGPDGPGMWGGLSPEVKVVNGKYFISEKLVVGKLIFKIPWLGHVALFMQRTEGKIFLVITILVLLLWSFLFPPKEKSEQGTVVEEQDLNVNYL
jgi:signal peptidase